MTKIAKWQRSGLRDKDTFRMLDLVKQAGIPLNAIGEPSKDNFQLIFDDTATEQQMQQAISIVNGYDAAAADATEEQNRTAVMNDLSPLQSITALIAESQADFTLMGGALWTTSNQQVVRRLLVREQKILHALYRVVTLLMQQGR